MLSEDEKNLVGMNYLYKVICKEEFLDEALELFVMKGEVFGERPHRILGWASFYYYHDLGYNEVRSLLDDIGEPATKFIVETLD